MSQKWIQNRNFLLSVQRDITGSIRSKLVKFWIKKWSQYKKSWALLAQFFLWKNSFPLMFSCISFFGDDDRNESQKKAGKRARIGFSKLCCNFPWFPLKLIFIFIGSILTSIPIIDKFLSEICNLSKSSDFESEMIIFSQIFIFIKSSNGYEISFFDEYGREDKLIRF